MQRLPIVMVETRVQIPMGTQINKYDLMAEILSDSEKNLTDSPLEFGSAINGDPHCNGESIAM